MFFFLLNQSNFGLCFRINKLKSNTFGLPKYSTQVYVRLCSQKKELNFYSHAGVCVTQNGCLSFLTVKTFFWIHHVIRCVCEEFESDFDSGDIHLDVLKFKVNYGFFNSSNWTPWRDCMWSKIKSEWAKLKQKQISKKDYW